MQDSERPTMVDPEPPPASPELMTKAECAAYLRVHENTVERYSSQAEDPLPFFKLKEGGSGAVRFRRTSVDEWLARRAPNAED